MTKPNTLDIEEIVNAAQEIVDSGEEYLNIKEAERGEYEPEDLASAKSEFESALRTLLATLPRPLLTTVLPDKVKE